MADMLASTSDLTTLLQQDVAPATATLLIEAATGIVQTIAGQRIVEVVGDVAVLDLEACDTGLWLDLPQHPVRAVSSVLVGATPVAGTDYTVQLSRGRLWRRTGWRLAIASSSSWLAPSTVTVTYTHGYAEGDQRLQTARQAVLSLAASAFANPTGVSREQIDDYQVAYEAMSARMDGSSALQSLICRQYGRPAGSVKLVSTGSR